MELSFRGKIATVRELRKPPYSERVIEVTNDRLTGEAILDEALKLIKTDSQPIGAWIDLMSGTIPVLSGSNGPVTSP
jgi:golgi phosphoprotein 3